MHQKVCRQSQSPTPPFLICLIWVKISVKLLTCCFLAFPLLRSLRLYPPPCWRYCSRATHLEQRSAENLGNTLSAFQIYISVPGDQDKTAARSQVWVSFVLSLITGALGSQREYKNSNGVSSALIWPAYSLIPELVNRHM